MISPPIYHPPRLGPLRNRVFFQYSTGKGHRPDLLAGILTGILSGGLFLASCSSPLPASSEPVTPLQGSFSTSPTDLQAATAPLYRRLRQFIPPADPVTVTLYRLDNQCQDFVAASIPVSRERPITDTVGILLADQTFTAFDLSGYRVEFDRTTATVTIDLRLNPDSFRLITSLSSCEQLALFGSIRKTLLANPDWQIQTVRFTNRGEPIVL